MPLQSLAAKFRAFGCAVYEINGHVIEEILGALTAARAIHDGKPKVIVAATVKGKGVSFMENVPKWHGVAPNDEEYQEALKEIREGVKS